MVSKGYMYIILAGEKFQLASSNLFTQYFTKLGVGALLLTMIFAAILGFLSIWFITKNLRLITQTVRKFREGDFECKN